MPGSAIFSPDALVLRAPAKINLWLKVLGKREDGFHEIQSRLCPLELGDRLIINPATSGGLDFRCNEPSLPTGEGNLVVKAVRLFEEAAKIKVNATIGLEKSTPHGAGLGGGSSDAAAALRGLNELYGFPLAQELLSQLAAKIGSDVPFFLHQSAADVSGRGEKVALLSFDWELPLVLIKPPFAVPTPEVYQRWGGSREIPGIFYGSQICPWGHLANDLERPAFEKFLHLAEIKAWLIQQPETLAALMTGSGSTMYAIPRTQVEALALADKARREFGPETWVCVTRTLPS